MTGKRYKSLRMLRLKFSGTSAQEQFEIIREFKLEEEYRKINDLRIQKDAIENFLVKLRKEIDLHKQCSLDAVHLEIELEKILAELNDINEQLMAKDAGKIGVEEYYEKLVELLLNKKVPFDEIDLAEVNKAYSDFFLMLSGSLNNSTKI